MEHIVIRTKGAVTGINGPDCHIFIDGRRSPRTRRIQIIEDWRTFKERYENYAPNAEPITPDHYVRLGVCDNGTYPVPFVTANTHQWIISDEWLLYAYISNSHMVESYTKLFHQPTRRMFNVAELTLNDRQRDWKTRAAIRIEDEDGYEIYAGKAQDRKVAIQTAVRELSKELEKVA